ncbi:MAG: YbbR-like domain-containing protein [Candidatus Coprovivens sp.]
MNNIFKPLKNLILIIYKFIDKFIVTPISTLIYKINSKIGKENKLEKLLNLPNVLLYVSLLFAVVLFYFVDIKANTLVSTDAEILSDIPVVVNYNTSAYVIEGVPETVDITLTGKKSELYLARQLGDNVVTLDLTDYDDTDSPVRAKLTYNKTIDNLSYKIDPTYVTVTIKKKVSDTKTVTYDLLNQDSLDEKLSVKSVELSKTEVVVRGSQDTIDKLATVKALINLDNSDFSKAGTYNVDDIKLVAYGSEGEIINNVEIVATNISATLVLDSYSKEVPVKIVTTGDLVSGKAISSITVNGKDVSDYKVTIYGEESVLEGINMVPITIDVQGQGNNGSKTSNVVIPKPSGVRSLSENSIAVVLNFGEAKQKTITINGIKTRNVPNGSVANLAHKDDAILEIQVIGVQSVLDSIDEENPGINAFVDLTGYTIGTYPDVPVQVEGNDSRLQYIVTKNVEIIISQ